MSLFKGNRAPIRTRICAIIIVCIESSLLGVVCKTPTYYEGGSLSVYIHVAKKSS